MRADNLFSLARRTPSSRRTQVLAAAAVVTFAVSGCGRSSDGGVEAAAAPLTRPIDAFTADVETRLLDNGREQGTVTWRVEYVDATAWTATVVRSSGQGVPDVGSTRSVADGRYVETIPDVVDLLEYFTEAELDDFAERFGAKGPDIVAALVRDGILVPGDQRIVDEPVKGTPPAPHPLFELYDFDASYTLDELDPRLRNGGGIVLEREGDTFEYDRDGAPLRYESVAGGSVVAEAEVTRFERNAGD